MQLSAAFDSKRVGLQLFVQERNNVELYYAGMALSIALLVKKNFEPVCPQHVRASVSSLPATAPDLPESNSGGRVAALRRWQAGSTWCGRTGYIDYARFFC